MIVAALVALAVVASLFLIFSNSVQLLRVGLVIALWAATLGAIAMTKYRRESAADKAKVRDLQKVYELQLEREISARREYELGVEARVRGEAVLDTSEIAALRAELAALRGNLEILFEGKMPADRTALTAEARRMRELGSGVGTPASSQPHQQQPQQATGYRRTLEPDPEYPGTAATPTFAPDPAYAGAGRGQTFATPFDEPVTAEVALVPEEQPAAPEQPRPAAPTAAAKPEPVVTPAPTPVAKPVPEPAESTPEPEPEPEPELELEPSAVTGRRSRRRAEPQPEPEPGAHSAGGLTVAEIMANMKTADAADEPRPGRRRRD